MLARLAIYSLNVYVFNEDRHPHLGKDHRVLKVVNTFLKKARDETSILKFINMSASSEKPVYLVPLASEEWVTMVIPLKYSFH